MPTPPPMIVYAQACDLCRKMKIKCERKGEQCAHCLASNAVCTFAPVERKPPKVKRPELLESMEQRIERMEAILSTTDLGSTSRASSPADADEHELADKFASLTVSPDGEAFFIGSASALSLLSGRGKQWIAQHTGATDLDTLNPQPVSSIESEPELTSEMFQPMSEEDREPLPKKSIAVKYANAFFRCFNSVYPILGRESFLSQLDRMYTSRTVDDVAWYSCLNAILGLGCLLQYGLGPDRDYATNKKARKENTAQAWGYFRNAASHLVDLMLRPSVMTLQALLAMAFMLQSTTQHDVSSTIATAVAQTSHRLGLHVCATAAEESPVVSEQRRNLFWLIFILDQTTSLRTGRPPLIQEEDIGVRLPERATAYSSDSSVSSSPAASPSTPCDFSSMGPAIFRAHCELSISQSRLQRELYSPRSRIRSPLERLTSISQIDTALQVWQRSIPHLLRPGREVNCPDEISPHIIQLHLSFYDTLACLHRVSPFNRAWFAAPTQPPSPAESPVESKGRVYASAAIAIDAARSSLSILQQVEVQSIAEFAGACNTFIAKGPRQHYLVSAALTLVAHLFSNPEDGHAEGDLALLDSVVSKLDHNNVGMLQRLCTIATAHIAKTKSRAGPRSKRSRDDSRMKVQPARIRSKEIAPRRTSVSASPYIYDRRQSQSQSHSPATHASLDMQTPSSVQSSEAPYNAYDFPHHSQHAPELLHGQTFMEPGSSTSAATVPLDAMDTSHLPHNPYPDPFSGLHISPDHYAPPHLSGDVGAQMGMPNEWDLADPQYPHPYPPHDELEPYPSTSQQIMPTTQHQQHDYPRGHDHVWQGENNALGLWYDDADTSPPSLNAGEGYVEDREGQFKGLGSSTEWHRHARGHNRLDDSMEREMCAMQGVEGMLII